MDKIDNDSWKRSLLKKVERYPEQMTLQLNKTVDCTPEEQQKWFEEDFFMKGDFDPLVLFVVIPTIIQLTVFFGMLGVFVINGQFLD